MDPMMMSSDRQKSKATWVVVIIIVLVALSFLVYYFRNQLSTYSTTVNVPANSDTVSSINKDLQATNVNDLDKEVSDINKELAAPVTQ